MRAESKGRGDPVKRHAIIEAAKTVFLRSGYRAGSMDAVAREAGVSKQTVYAHFGSKEALFEAIIVAKADELMAPVSAPVPDGEGGDGDPEAVLTAIGRGFVAILVDPDAMALYRVILSESARFPELAEAFYRAGPQTAAAGLAAYLARQHEVGRLTVDDPLAAARLFFSMFRGDLYLRSLLGVGSVPEGGEAEVLVTRAVGVFLKAYRR